MRAVVTRDRPPRLKGRESRKGRHTPSRTSGRGSWMGKAPIRLVIFFDREYFRMRMKIVKSWQPLILPLMETMAINKDQVHKAESQAFLQINKEETSWANNMTLPLRWRNISKISKTTITLRVIFRFPTPIQLGTKHRVKEVFQTCSGTTVQTSMEWKLTILGTWPRLRALWRTGRLIWQPTPRCRITFSFSHLRKGILLKTCSCKLMVISKEISRQPQVGQGTEDSKMVCINSSRSKPNRITKITIRDNLITQPRTKWVNHLTSINLAAKTRTW